MKIREFEDPIKTVLQLWRFFSSCRRVHARFDLASSVVGGVLALDNWLVIADTLRESVLQSAVKMAAEKDPEISDADRKLIIFVASTELESILSTATKPTFNEALAVANSIMYKGWRHDGIRRDLSRSW